MTLSRRNLLAAGAGMATMIAAPAVRSQAKREITLWHSYTQPARANYQRAMADRFETANPGVKIAIEAVPPPQFHSRIVAARAAGALPDIVTQSPAVVTDYYASGFVKPADKIVADLGRDFWLPGQLENYGTFDGKVITLPYHYHSRIWMYRKDRLAAAGLQPPDNWEQALAAATAMNAPGKYNGWVFPLNQGDSGATNDLYVLSLTNGAVWLDSKGDVSFDSAPIREAVEYMVEVVKRAGGPSVLDYRVNEMFNLCNSGLTSVVLDASPLIGVAEADAPQVAEQLDAVHVPMKKNRASLIQGSSLTMLTSGRDNEEAVSSYMKFMLEADNLRGFMHTIPLFMYPTTKSASGEKFFDNPVLKKFRKVVELSQEAASFGKFFGTEKGGLNIFAGQITNSRITEEMFSRIIAGKTPIPDAIAMAHERMADITRDIKRRTRR